MIGRKKPTDGARIPFKHRLASLIGVSDDIISAGLIELRGRCEMTVGSCKKIEKYTDTEIILRLLDCSVSINGRALSCYAYFSKTVGITGFIDSVIFIDSGAQNPKGSEKKQ